MKEIYCTKDNWIINLKELDESYAVMIIHPRSDLNAKAISKVMVSMKMNPKDFRIEGHGSKMFIQKI